MRKQKLFLSTCDSDFLRFVCECIDNILRGNVAMKKDNLYPFYSELTQLRKQSLSNRRRRDILQTTRGIRLLKVVSEAIARHFQE